MTPGNAVNDAGNVRAKRASRAAVLSASVTYLAFAVPTSMLGVIWPDVRERFDQSLGRLGLVTLVYGIGRLVTATIGRPAVRRFGMGAAFTCALVMLAVACAVMSLSTTWVMFLASVCAVGAVSGTLDSIGATFIAGRASVGDAGLIHGSYGIGATIGPILVAVIANWRLAVAAGVLGAGVAVACATRARGEWPAAVSDDLVGVTPRGRAPLPAVVISMLTLGVFVAVEVTAGSWAFSYLTEGRDVSDRVAAIGVAGFWGGATLGRVTMARHGVVRIIERLGLFGLATLCAVTVLGLVAGPSLLAPAFLALTGVTLAPIVPTLFATTTTRVGAEFATQVSGWQLIATNVGAISLPALVGKLVDSHGADVIPTVVIAALVVGVPLLLVAKRLPDRLAAAT